MRTVVVGVGNVLLGDEGVGVHAVRELMGEKDLGEVELVDGGTVGFELLAYLRGAAKIIVVDAVNVPAEPGTVVRILGEDLRPGDHIPRSAHDTDLLDLFAGSVPPLDLSRVVVLGVVPSDCTTPSLDLSPVVRLVLPRLLDEIRAEIRRPLTQS